MRASAPSPAGLSLRAMRSAAASDATAQAKKLLACKPAAIGFAHRVIAATAARAVAVATRAKESTSTEDACTAAAMAGNAPVHTTMRASNTTSGEKRR